MIVLDSNVISALMRRVPNPQVKSWLDGQPAESVWTTSVCVFEIRFGINILVPGKRRAFLDHAFDRILDGLLAGRVLGFDTAAATASADLAGQLRPRGLTIETRDLQIAGIVAARRATLATRNVKHFVEAGIPLVDPWGAVDS